MPHPPAGASPLIFYSPPPPFFFSDMVSPILSHRLPHSSPRGGDFGVCGLGMGWGGPTKSLTVLRKGGKAACIATEIIKGNN
jgi:hypothetical protein